MMRVLRTEYDGRIVLNPPDAIVFVASSKAGAAGVVLAGTDLVVSTVYTDHETMMTLAGIRQRSFSFDGLANEYSGEEITTDPAMATFRGGMSGTRISFDIWNYSDRTDIEDSVGSLQMAYDYFKSHRKLRSFDHLEIAIYNEEFQRTHTFGADGLVDERFQRPAPKAPAFG